MDELFSCVTCDHSATEHSDSGCASCSCLNPFEALADDDSDAGADVIRTKLGSSDEQRFA